MTYQNPFQEMQEFDEQFLVHISVLVVIKFDAVIWSNIKIKTVLTKIVSTNILLEQINIRVDRFKNINIQNKNGEVGRKRSLILTSRAKTTIATWFFWLAATSFNKWTPRPIARAGGRSSQTGSLILSVQSLDKGYIALFPSRRTATVSF